jgi:prepilin-type N-terminal cleavage/methylation domain-containing protein
MMRNRGFTLVEVMIATVLATMISIFLMQLMSRGQTIASRFSGKIAAARDAHVILQKLKMALRGSRDLRIEGTGFSAKNSNGAEYHIEYRPDRQGLEWTNAPSTMDRWLGHRQIYAFQITQPLQNYPQIYKLSLNFKNPEARDPSPENALTFTTLVSERVPYGDRIPDKAWIPNAKDECPPSCQ